MPLISAADMTDPQAIAAMVVEAAAGSSAASTSSSTTPASSTSRRSRTFPLDKWDRIIAINLSSAFHTMRAAIPGMKAEGWGRVINIASAHSLVASPYKSAYVAAKHGIAGLTKTAALELATLRHHLSTRSAPGYVWTPLVEAQIPDTMAARKMTKEQVIDEVLLKAQPTKEFITIDEVAALAMYLCSDAAKGMTGGILSLDGGWTAA